MISTKRPRDFKPIYDVASCFIERDGKILLLLRLPDKSEGNKWGMPAGKIEPNEKPAETVLREVIEETGLAIAEHSPTLFETYFVRYPDYDFVYHVFHVRVPSHLVATMNKYEHQKHVWATPQEALKMELVKHQDDCIKLFYFA